MDFVTDIDHRLDKHLIGFQPDRLCRPWPTGGLCGASSLGVAAQERRRDRHEPMRDRVDYNRERRKKALRLRIERLREHGQTSAADQLLADSKRNQRAGLASAAKRRAA